MVKIQRLFAKTNLKIPVYKIDYIRINVNGWAKLPHPFLKADWYLYRDG
jgi:hypothetical protein